MRHLWIGLLIVTFAPLNALCQSFTIYNYSIPEGMPSSETYDVFEDSRGFLWFASDNGVVRFDGTTLEAFHAKDGLTDPVVFSFFEDHKNRIWFRTFSGKLSYYLDGKIHRYPYNDSIAKIHSLGIIRIFVDKKDQVHFTTMDYSGVIDSQGNTKLNKLHMPGLYYYTMENGEILGPGYRGLPVGGLNINGRRFHISLSVNEALSRVYSTAAWQNLTYFSVNNDLFVFDGASLGHAGRFPQQIISLSVDRENNLWIGFMNGGAHRYSDHNLRNPFILDFLNGKSVTKVYQDHERGFWFSTLENGIFHLPNLLIENFPVATESRIRAVLALPEFVLLGDQTGRLLKIDRHTKESSFATQFDAPILSMQYHSSDKIYLSTSNFVARVDKNLKEEKRHGGFAADFTADNNGNVWAIGANLIRKFDAENEDIHLGHPNGLYRNIFADDSLIYLADRTGLDILNHEIQRVAHPKTFADYKISNFLEINDSILFVATIGNGFALLDRRDQSARIYNSENAFLSDNIYSSILHQNVLWLGTEKGVIRIPVANVLKDSLEFSYLTRKSGLINNKIDFLIPVDGKVWAFSENAFSAIPINVPEFANETPIFYWKNVMVNREIKNIQELNLSNRQNNLNFSFGFISFNNENIFLRYRLNNNQNWTLTDENELLFQSLAPGQYNFKLEYSTDNVHWIHATQLAFTIAKPWWARWYTWAIGLTFLTVFGYLYFRYLQSIYRQKSHYLKIINDHQQRLIQSEIVALERERNRISKELHDRVGTNLSAIKLTVSQLLQQHREPQASDVEEQFQIAIREIKEIIYGLTPPSLERYGLFTGLRNYVGKLHKKIPLNISLQTFGIDNVSSEVSIIIFRILQELITNSIKHSFAKNITIHINSFEDIINIVYEDDGIGFVYDPTQSGLGLDSIESRIRSVNGTLKFDSGNFGVSYTIDIPVTNKKEVV